MDIGLEQIFFNRAKCKKDKALSYMEIHTAKKKACLHTYTTCTFITKTESVTLINHKAQDRQRCCTTFSAVVTNVNFCKSVNKPTVCNFIQKHHISKTG